MYLKRQKVHSLDLFVRRIWPASTGSLSFHLDLRQVYLLDLT